MYFLTAFFHCMLSTFHRKSTVRENLSENYDLSFMHVCAYLVTIAKVSPDPCRTESDVIRSKKFNIYSDCVV